MYKLTSLPTKLNRICEHCNKYFYLQSELFIHKRVFIYYKLKLRLRDECKFQQIKLQIKHVFI
jgi:hypothetical protein